MVHFCSVPDCSCNSNRDKQLSFFSLPLKRKALLKRWIHVIGRKNLPVNRHTRICSRHFINASKRLLRPDEVPSLHLPCFSSVATSRKPPKERISPQSPVSLVEVQTEVSGIECGCDSKIEMLMKEVSVLKCKYQERKFCLANIKKDDYKICDRLWDNRPLRALLQNRVIGIQG